MSEQNVYRDDKGRPVSKRIVRDGNIVTIIIFHEDGSCTTYWYDPETGKLMKHKTMKDGVSEDPEEVTDQAEKDLVKREWDRHEELMKKQNQETGSGNTGENTGGDGGGEAGSPAVKAGPNATAI